MKIMSINRERQAFISKCQSDLKRQNLTLSYSYLVNKPKDQRSLVKELVGATFASVFAGFGAIFFIMWTGIFL